MNTGDFLCEDLGRSCHFWGQWIPFSLRYLIFQPIHHLLFDLQLLSAIVGSLHRAPVACFSTFDLPYSTISALKAGGFAQDECTCAPILLMVQIST